MSDVDLCQVYENVPVPQGRGQTEKPPEPFPRTSAGGKNASNTQPEDDEDDDDDDVYNSEDLYGSFKSLSSAQLDAFQRYLLACLGSGELGDQFENSNTFIYVNLQNLPKGMRHPHTIGLSEENKRKNRFKALCTYDFNRVVLRRPSGDNSSDYINATYIKEGITQIVMLANLQEDGKDKCEEYWPASGKSQTHGHMTVRGLEAQYKFLHEVILEAHTSRATRVSTGQFDDTFADTIQTNTSNSRINSEFQMLKYMGQFAAKPKHTMATMPENRDKNRNMDALPDDDYVVYLSAHVRGRNQYINAVYMSMPIPSNTLIDFWRLVDGCHVTRIVSLGSDKEEETVETQYRYLYHVAQEYIRHVGVKP
nr:hypothetical protein BaRGS_012646 [Batillaria attramentaria]